jgi:hypothetical protein
VLTKNLGLDGFQTQLDGRGHHVFVGRSHGAVGDRGHAVVSIGGLSVVRGHDVVFVGFGLCFEMWKDVEESVWFYVWRTEFSGVDVVKKKGSVISETRTGSEQVNVQLEWCTTPDQ